MALKKTDPGIRFSGIKVAPDEIDQVRQYIVMNPSVSASYLGTVTSASAAALVLDSVKCDYPRTLLLTLTGVAGGMGGTAVINGKNQFGETIQESIGFATANAGGTKAGTQIFAEVTSGTVTPVGLGGTAVGTASLGFAIGTAANQVAKFGLLDKVGALSDVKVILWNDADVMKAVNGGTVTSTYVDTTNQSFNIGQVVAAADSFIIRYRSTYSSEETIQKL